MHTYETKWNFMTAILETRDVDRVRYLNARQAQDIYRDWYSRHRRLNRVVLEALRLSSMGFPIQDEQAPSDTSKFKQELFFWPPSIWVKSVGWGDLPSLQPKLHILMHMISGALQPTSSSKNKVQRWQEAVPDTLYPKVKQKQGKTQQAVCA